MAADLHFRRQVGQLEFSSASRALVKPDVSRIKGGYIDVGKRLAVDLDQRKVVGIGGADGKGEGKEQTEHCAFHGLLSSANPVAENKKGDA